MKESHDVTLARWERNGTLLILARLCSTEEPVLVPRTNRTPSLGWVSDVGCGGLLCSVQFWDADGILRGKERLDTAELIAVNRRLFPQESRFQRTAGKR